LSGHIRPVLSGHIRPVLSGHVRPDRSFEHGVPQNILVGRAQSLLDDFQESLRNQFFQIPACLPDANRDFARKRFLSRVAHSVLTGVSS
jgi:hypothetical protein